MLTADLIRVKRRGSTLEIIPLRKAAKESALELARLYLAVTKSHVGKTRGELDEALSAIRVHARDRKVGAGLRKLIFDRCKFEVEDGSDPAELRREVFGRASAARKALEPGQRFDPATVLAEAAREHEIEPAELERLLYVDLRSAHRLLSFDSLSEPSLIELYELGQAQAVLLRAVGVVARVRCQTPGVYRALFRKLKFLRLLHTIEPIEDGAAGSPASAGDSAGDSESEWAGGYRITIDGPYSMFKSVTKYGLQLALALPALRACDRWAIEADVRWGKDRKPFLFSATSHDSHVAEKPEPMRLPDEVAALLARFEERHESGKTLWRARPSTDILSLPGAGVCVPDLIFEHGETGVCIYLEVMGFWSRNAVWQRVELVEAGLPQQILFAVSKRLRVSEKALDSDLPGALYVYKGAMNATIIEKRLDEMAGQKTGSPE